MRSPNDQTSINVLYTADNVAQQYVEPGPTVPVYQSGYLWLGFGAALKLNLSPEHHWLIPKLLMLEDAAGNRTFSTVFPDFSCLSQAHMDVPSWRRSTTQDAQILLHSTTSGRAWKNAKTSHESATKDKKREMVCLHTQNHSWLISSHFHLLICNNNCFLSRQIDIIEVWLTWSYAVITTCSLYFIIIILTAYVKHNCTGEVC